MSEMTTIQISKRVRDMLRELGRKGETYDQIILRLIDKARKERED